MRGRRTGLRRTESGQAQIIEKERSMENRIRIGQIVNAVGLKVEVKVYSYSERGRYEELPEVFVEQALMRIEGVRYQKQMVILKLTGVCDRTAAEALKGSDLYIREEELPVLPEDTYYIRDLLGMAVCQENGRMLGELVDVIQSSAQDIYEVRLENGKKLLIPVVGEFVLNIDMEQRVITVRLIEGMLELQS